MSHRAFYQLPACQHQNQAGGRDGTGLVQELFPVPHAACRELHHPPKKAIGGEFPESCVILGLRHQLPYNVFHSGELRQREDD